SLFPDPDLQATFLQNGTLNYLFDGVSPASGFVGSLVGDVTAETPSFDFHQLADGYVRESGFSVAPDGKSVAIEAIKIKQGGIFATDLLQGDLSDPHSVTTLPLSSDNVFAGSSAGNEKQGLFIQTTQDGINAYRCTP